MPSPMSEASKENPESNQDSKVMADRHDDGPDFDAMDAVAEKTVEARRKRIEWVDLNEPITQSEFDESEARRVELSEIKGRPLSEEEAEEHDKCMAIRRAFSEQQARNTADKEKLEKVRAREQAAKERRKAAVAALRETEARVAKADWSQGWCLINSVDKVGRPGELRLQSQMSFNVEFAKVMPSNLNLGTRITPFALVRDTVGIKVVDDVAYAAGWPTEYRYAGRDFLNTYNAARTPVAAAEYTKEGRAAIRLILRHIKLMFPKKGDARKIESWHALNVREPGRLMNVALLVKGAPGDGKTEIFHIMPSVIMGSENVGEASNAEIKSDFSKWAIGRAIRVVEELKVAGVNRYAILDAIKPFITNEDIVAIGKGKDGWIYRNTTNYVGLTNHEDALPISDDDRRWWIFFTQFNHINELAALVGDLKVYFTKLRAAIREHAGELRKHFLECKIHPEVFHGMLAPITDDKKKMIDAESAANGADFLDGYIANGNVVGISKDVVAVGCLSDQLERDMGRDVPKSKQMNRLLKSRGFHKCDKVMNWGYKTYNVYVHDESLTHNGDKETRKKIADMLAATMPDEDRARAMAAMGKLQRDEDEGY